MSASALNASSQVNSDDYYATSCYAYAITILEKNVAALRAYTETDNFEMLLMRERKKVQLQIRDLQNALRLLKARTVSRTSPQHSTHWFGSAR